MGQHRNPAIAEKLHWAPGWSRAALVLLPMLLSLPLIFQQEAVTAWSKWSGTAAYNHGFMILPITLYLVWRLRHPLARLVPRPAWRGVALALLCAALWTLGKAALITELRQFAIIGMILALVLGLLGRQIFMMLRFPLLYLVLMVPTGAFLLTPLQKITAFVVEIMLRLAGITVWRDGVVIEAPMGIYRVEPGCAGLNFLLASLTLAMLFSYLLYSRPWKRLLCVALAPVLSMTANVVRVFGIIWLAEATHRKIDIVDDHVLYGWGFYSVLMGIAMMIAVRYEDPLPEVLPLPDLPGRPPVDWRRLGLRVALLGLFIFGPPAYFAIRFPPPPSGSSIALPLPAQFGNWRSVPPSEDWIDHWEHSGTAFRRAWQAPDGRTVEMLISYHWRQSDSGKITEVGNAMHESEHDAWAVIGRGRIEPPVGDRVIPSGLYVLSKGDARRYAASLYWSGGRFAPDILKARLQSVYGLLGSEGRAAVIVLTAADSDDRPARDAIGDFLLEAGDLPRLLQAASLTPATAAGSLSAPP